ncbi:6'''-hydroxyparomomycin C oxidase [compost metagenome]
MIISTAGPPRTLEYDICVIGSGPAALTFTGQFLEGRSNLKVLLVESGETLDPAYTNEHDQSLSRRYSDLQTSAQALYAGRLSGWLETNKPDYLTESRLRAFGGTGNVWSGWLCAMERLDLERGNWPVSYPQMMEFYEKVCAYYQIPSRWCLDAQAQDAGGIWQSMPLPSQMFRTRPLLARRINFGQLFRERLIHSENVDVLLGANAVRIDTCGANPSKSAHQLAFASVTEAPSSSIEHKVSASAFVIAAGCIESTRLLEASQLGAASGALGQYFQEHFYIWNAGTFHLTENCAPYRSLYLQEKTLSVSTRDSVVGMIVPTARYLTEKGGGSFRAILGGGPGIPGTLNLCCEQLPAHSNRIVLDNVATHTRTAAKTRVHVHNELSAADTKTIENAVMSLGESLLSSGLITHFKPAPFDVDPTQWKAPHRLAPGNHPSGTTRMSSDPSQGVVDSDCKVHGVGNVYVASTSVFPMAGYANPTLTLMALAFRLAEKLQEHG